MSGLDRIDIALRWMRNAGAGYEAARGMIRDARKHRNDAVFVSAMVRMARTINHSSVSAARAAREWVQP